MARPTKYNDERARAITEALRAGNTRKAACAYAGICEDTFAAWLVRYPDFSGAVKKAEADAVVRNVAIIQKAAGENWCAAAWWLERRQFDEWGKREKQEQSGQIRVVVEYADADGEAPAPAPGTGAGPA